MWFWDCILILNYLAWRWNYGRQKLIFWHSAPLVQMKDRYRRRNTDPIFLHENIILSRTNYTLSWDRALWLELNKQRSKMRRSRSWPQLPDSSEPDLMPMNDQITDNQRLLQSFDGSRSTFISQRHGIFYSFDEDSVEEQEFPASIQKHARRSTRRRKLGLFY